MSNALAIARHDKAKKRYGKHTKTCPVCLNATSEETRCGIGKAMRAECYRLYAIAYPKRKAGGGFGAKRKTK